MFSIQNITEKYYVIVKSGQFKAHNHILLLLEECSVILHHAVFVMKRLLSKCQLLQ